MSIGKRADEALASLTSGDAEAALLTACVLVGATSRLEYPNERHDSVRYKKFLSTYIWIVGLIAFQVVAKGYKVTCLHPELKPTEDGTVPLEDVIYKVVRCGLLHEADMSQYVQLSDSMIIGYVGGKYVFSERLPLALIVAAMLSPCNSGEKLRGRRNEIMELLVANEI